MTDPFLESKDGRLLEEEVKRLRLENRELRLKNTNLRARLTLATSTTSSVDAEAHQARFAGAGADGAATSREFGERQGEAKPGEPTFARDGADIVPTPSGNAVGATGADVTTEPPPHGRRTRGPPPSSTTGSSSPVSAARIQEAVQQVKRELQGELEAHRKAAASAKAEKEQLKREFEHFVSTTCEREAAYQLVYMQLYREMEEQKELVRSAQAQLEEQRLQSVEMRKTLEAAVAAASHSGGGGAPQSFSSPVTPSDTSAVVPPAREDLTVIAAKRQRTTKEAANAPAPRQHIRRLPKDLNWAGLAGVAPAAGPNGAPQEAETASATDSSVPDSTGPRELKIIAGGATLQNTRKAQHMKRSRDAVSETSLPGSAPSVRRSVRKTITGFTVPVAPVFASASAKAAPNSSSGTGSPNNINKRSDVCASSAAVALLPSSSLGQVPASAAVESFWRLLAQHSEATQGFLPLWQHLNVLRGSDRHTVLEVLVSLLVHLLSPDVPAAFLTTQTPQPASFASLPHSFTSQTTSIAVVATAIRLLAVQLEDAAEQQRGNAETQQQARMYLSSLFYRVCVVTLCRWQVSDSAFEVLEHWAMAVHHLYGFQPALLQLMQYTNTTSAYHRTRLVHSWISFTAQCIFSQCFTASSSSALPAETAVARWRELCDSVGWSTHAQPLERIEAAAARCIATTRVGHGPFTAACAEEALLSLRLAVLYKGFDHMEQIAKLLEQPGVLPMVITKEIYAELVSLAVRDRIPFRTQAALHHALHLLREYLQEVAPERCTSAEHFVCAPRRSHVLAALALLRVGPDPLLKKTEAPLPSSASVVGAQGYAVMAASEVREAGRKAALQWLQAQKVALEMVRQSRAVAPDRLVLLRDTPLGRILLREAARD
ncbi:hypothetical protein ABL78_3537 [Leptomonas seymouri]|uniref:Uncharacterized protein n=1 Tax=Leptomonas seymouri TaxID=5684 RepID=A0A0N0P691_LEPSE|nr:hypothetical protein ABL78_3537 [Leptomonas seymouri]|eukprot:KPI87349.1 hypothetical protein ABL78_3537 [Leptomonas seymouri]